jgi:hypothetical protein
VFHVKQPRRSTDALFHVKQDDVGTKLLPNAKISKDRIQNLFHIDPAQQPA